MRRSLLVLVGDGPPVRLEREDDGVGVGFGFSKCCVHSRENLKEKTRCVDVAGGVSLSVLEDLAWSGGRDRAMAVWSRASSRVLVGLPTRGSDADGGSGVDVKVPGSIFPMNVHRFLLGALGESVPSLRLFSVLSDLVTVGGRRDCRFEDFGIRPDSPCEDAELTIPSKPRNMLAVGI